MTCMDLTWFTRERERKWKTRPLSAICGYTKCMLGTLWSRWDIFIYKFIFINYIYLFIYLSTNAWFREEPYHVHELKCDIFSRPCICRCILVYAWENGPGCELRILFLKLEHPDSTSNSRSDWAIKDVSRLTDKTLTTYALKVKVPWSRR